MGEDNLAVRLNTIQPANVRLNVKGTTAWVSCDEEIYAPKFVRGLGSTRKLVGKSTATNLFRKVHGRWLLAHHHATWLSEEYDNKSKNKDYARPNPALRLMGNYAQSSSSTQSSSGPVKKVVMGSLSDILNGGLSDILSSSTSSSKSSDDGEFKTIIHLSSPLDDDDDDEVDDDDDDSLLSKWAKLGSSSSTGGSFNSKAILPSSLIKNNNNNSYDDQASMRQGCIQTLRKLCAQGLLLVSPNNNAVASTSENDDSEDNAAVDEDGEEEFADQCRVLADSLLEKS